MYIYTMLLLALVTAENIGRRYSSQDKMPISDQGIYMGAFERWGFKFVGAYSVSNEDSNIPDGSNPCFFVQRPCIHSCKEQENHLSEIGWKWVRYFEFMNASSKSNMLEELLNDDKSTLRL